MWNVRLLMIMFAAALIAGCGPSGIQQNADPDNPGDLPPPPIEPGLTVVDFEEPHGSDAYLRLSNEIGTESVVLVFYRGSWCPQCRNQLGELAKYTKEFEMRGARVIAVSADSPEVAAKMAQEEGIDFPLLSDEDLSTIDAYDLRDSDEDFAKPATIVIAPDGSIVYQKIGDNPKDRPTAKDILEQVENIQPTEDKPRPNTEPTPEPTPDADDNVE